MIKELEYELTKEDLEKGLGTINSISNKGITKIQFLGFLVVILLAVISGILAKEFLFPIVIIVFFFILIFLLKGKSYVKVIGKYETQKFDIIINSEENTFINKNDASTTVIKWNKVPKIDNTKDSLLIFTSANVAFIIPKRIFESEQEMNEVWDLIQECYNKYREELKMENGE